MLKDELEVFSCPNCGAPLFIKKDGTCTCEYCGTVVGYKREFSEYAGYESPYQLQIIKKGAEVILADTALTRDMESYIFEHGENPDDYIKRQIVDQVSHILYNNFDQLFTWEKSLDYERFQTVYRAKLRVMENEGYQKGRIDQGFISHNEYVGYY